MSPKFASSVPTCASASRIAVLSAKRRLVLPAGTAGQLPADSLTRSPAQVSLASSCIEPDVSKTKRMLGRSDCAAAGAASEPRIATMMASVSPNAERFDDEVKKVDMNVSLTRGPGDAKLRCHFTRGGASSA